METAASCRVSQWSLTRQARRYVGWLASEVSERWPASGRGDSGRQLSCRAVQPAKQHCVRILFLCYNQKAAVEQEPQETEQARKLKSSSSLEWDNSNITKVFPSTFSHILITAQENNPTPTNQSTLQVPLSNPQNRRVCILLLCDTTFLRQNTLAFRFISGLFSEDQRASARAARDLDIATFSAVLAAVNAWHEGVEEEEWSKRAHGAVDEQTAMSPRAAMRPGCPRKASRPRRGKGRVSPGSLLEALCQPL